MTCTVHMSKPYAGNSHAWFDDGEVASAVSSQQLARKRGFATTSQKGSEIMPTTMKCRNRAGSKWLVSLLAGFVAVFNCTADEIVPKSSTGDLAADGTWTGDSAPGTTDPVKINSNDSTYTLSENMTIGSMWQEAQNVTFDFRDGNHTLTLTTPLSPWGKATLFRYPEIRSGATWTMLRGGKWECCHNSVSNAFDIVNLGFDGVYTFIMTNGCTITGFSSSYLFRRIANSKIVIADNSTFTGESIDFCDSFSESGNILEISSGSKVRGKYFYLTPGSRDTASLVTVKGAGSSLETSSWTYLGKDGYGGVTVRVSDQATFKPSSLVFNPNTHGSSVEVLSGATLEAGTYDWYGSNCWTFVSNATMNVRWARFSLGGANSSGVFGHHNKLTLAGPNTSFSNGAWDSDILGSSAKSHDNTFEILSGAQVSLTRAITIAQSTNGILRVGGSGSKFSIAGLQSSSSRYLLTFGSTNAFCNAIEVLDGGTLAANGLWVYGKNNSIVVSNATLSVGGYTRGAGDYGLWLGCGENASGNTLTLKGHSPKVELIRPNDQAHLEPLILQSGSVLRYEVPAEGYPEGHVVVSAGNLYAANYSMAGGRVEISCAEWGAVKSSKPAEAILFRAVDEMQASTQSWFASHDFGLPEGVTCFIRNGRDIVLRRRAAGGIRIIIR